MFTAVPFIPRVELPREAFVGFHRPEDGAVVGRILESGIGGVEAAVGSARATFAAHRKSPLRDRLRWLRSTAETLRRNAEELALIFSEDVGKPIRMAKFEVGRGSDFIDACAAVVPHLNGEVLSLDAVAASAGLLGILRRIPYGVAAGITPFNAPVNLFCCRKLRLL
jgi:acyl-CoA reductase-like NAD-dependent aldehyde dehydrogenase